MSGSKYLDVKVTKAKGKKSEEVNPSAFQMMKGAYALAGLFPQVVDKKEDDKPDVIQSCNLLMNLWTNKQVSTVDTADVDKAFTGSNIDDAFLPPIVGESKIMNKEMRNRIILALPARCQGYPWQMVFNTEVDGFSLAEFYRKGAEVDSMTLLLIEDLKGTKFGALLTDKLKLRDHYYGGGESFLFTFKDNEFKVFRWTGENNLIIRCNEQNFHIGSGDGHFGIMVDDNLNRGTSEKCLTFNNEILSTEIDFRVKAIECFGFEIIDEKETE